MTTYKTIPYAKNEPTAYMYHPLDRLIYHIRQYFGFSRRETYGTLCLLLLIVLIICLPSLLKTYDHYHLAQTHTAIEVVNK